MPTMDEMFPNLDYDSLNKGLNFIDFRVTDLTPNLNTNVNGVDFGGFNRPQDATVATPSEIQEAEVGEKEVDDINSESWESLSRKERIEKVKSSADGMPIVSTVDVKSLYRLAKRMDKKGMHKESAEIYQLAESFTRTLSTTQSHTNGQYSEHADVSVSSDQDGHPITIQKTFSNIEEAITYYNEFPLPELSQMKEKLDGFGLVGEAVALNRFFRKLTAWKFFKSGDKVTNTQLGDGVIAWDCGEGVYEVVFRRNPVMLEPTEIKNRIIYFDGRGQEDVTIKLPAGFYRALNNTPMFSVDAKVSEPNQPEEYEKHRISWGRLKLEKGGRTFTIEQYPLGQSYMGTTKISAEHLSPVGKY